jgi:hypothetical protein
MSAATGTTSTSAAEWLRRALGLAERDSPFPWQMELLRRFEHGAIERSLDIPTGLGKSIRNPAHLSLGTGCT